MNWRKSTYSGGGDGNSCVEVADLHPRIWIRDSKDPARTPLSFPAESFVAFLDEVRRGEIRPGRRA